MPRTPSDDSSPKFSPELEGSDESQRSAANLPCPGESLNSARKAKNMAVTEVASLLHLDVSVVRALESMDTENLPSAIFVKGYIRSYGRLLALEADQLVHQYEARYGTQQEKLTVSNAGEAPQKYYGRWLWALLGFALCLLVAWFWSNPDEQPVSTDSLRSEAPAAEQNAETGLAESAPEVVVEPLLPGLNDQPAPTSPPPVPSQALEADAAPVDEIAAETVDEPAAAPNEPVLAAGWLQLGLRASADSWVSIRDDRGERIFRDLLKAGQSHQLTGKAPVLINFGNADAVALTVNGQAYDHSAWHKTNGTARFVLNPVQ